MLKVHTVWDLGIDDSMSIGFWQRTATDIRLIDYYQNENFGLDHYFNYLEEKRREKKYNYGKHFAPHDSNRRELSSGKTIIQISKEMGYIFEPIPMSAVNDGILAVRLMFPRLFINEPNCEQAVSAWRNYKKKWNDSLLKYDDDPVHDWASHGADMLRYTAMIEKNMTNEDQEVYQPKRYIPESQYEGTLDPRQSDESIFNGIDIGRL
jgi:hypothetical protein